MQRSRLLPVLLVGIALLSLGRVNAAPISDKARREDPRLERRVTLQRPRVHVGELLERLSVASGVALTAGENRDGAADEQVAVFLKDTPLGDAMNALWSLVSFRKAEWHWVRSGGPGSYRYRLTRPRPAQLLEAWLRQKASETYENHVRGILASMEQGPEAVQALKERDPVAATLLNNERTRRGIGTFADALSPGDQAAILFDQKRQVRVPVSQLNPAGQEFVRSVWEQHYPPEIRQPNATPPESLDFYTSRRPGDVFPTLVVQLSGIGGYGYLGGPVLHRAFAEDLRAEWLLPGDAADASLEQREPKPPMPASPPGIVDRDRVLERRLKELSDGVPVSILARLPEGRTGDPGPPYLKTVAAFLAAIEKHPPCVQHKWRGDILLLSDTSWFTRAAGQMTAPYEVVKRLRERADNQEGFLSVDDLAEAAVRLTELQLLSLRKEFPVMANVAHWRPVLAIYGSAPRAAAQLKSRRGMPVAVLLRSLRGLSDARFEPFLSDGRANAVRVTFREEEGEAPRRAVAIELLDIRGRFLAGGGFTYTSWRPPDSTPAEPAGAPGR